MGKTVKTAVKTAIVHYWLVGMRGGEKVVEALLDLFPGADIYTHVYDPRSVSKKISSHNVYTSYIQKLPLSKKLYQLYMPLMPRALNGFNLDKYDLVISSESGPAKGVVPRPDAYHVCYCHSPMRYLWDMYHSYLEGTNFAVRFFMKRMIPGLRVWDIASSNLVDRFIANSSYVQKRIRRYYRREAEIVYPPVDIERYAAAERKPGDSYLFLGQLTGYKRADIAIEACAGSGRKLTVIGAGTPGRLTKRYGKSGLIRFMGHVPDEELPGRLAGARALLFPGIEDFGIVPVEANAAGCPVIAFKGGGVLDTVKEGITGLFFDEQSAESLIGALDEFESREAEFRDRDRYTDHVRRFSKEVFIRRMKEITGERRHV
jgi:glycosyltransferase involved in cell wall biosynthesis